MREFYENYLLMKKGKRILGNLILAAIVILIIGVFGYYIVKSNRSFVPQSFIDARNKNATIAADMVSNLDESVKSLNKISEEDSNHNYSAALSLVNQEAGRVETARVDSVDISKELIKMAEVVQDIKPSSAGKIALDAIQQETTLIEHVANYNSYFASLLNSLKIKFLNNGNYDGNQEVQQYISNMNKEAADINTTNDALNQKLKEFDGAVN
jgi:hypothetical protein